MRSATILGGSGFVGTHLVSRLAAEGWRCRVLTRRRERSKHLIVLPQVRVIEDDVFDRVSLERHCAGSSMLVNLVGILNERGDDGSGFRRAHVELTDLAVDAALAAGVRRYLHMSALNASATGPSHYLRTKGVAENLAHASAARGLEVTSFRPSVIFGPGDGFYNRFADLLRLSPVLPLACAASRFAPVYVNDVVEAMLRAAALPETVGQRYDLCGPTIYTLREVVAYTEQLLGLRRLVLPLAPGLSRLQAEVFEWVPGKPFSRDNFRSASIDSVCRGDHPSLKSLGIVPTPAEAIVPQYLGHATVKDRYALWRRSARRS